jgi:hypothetical protein
VCFRVEVEAAGERETDNPRSLRGRRGQTRAGWLDPGRRAMLLKGQEGRTSQILGVGKGGKRRQKCHLGPLLLLKPPLPPTERKVEEERRERL